MDSKNFFIIISIIISLFFYVIITNQTTKKEERYINSKYIIVFESEKRICPAVCVPMYELKEGGCVYNECGSGCGPDNLTTFLKKEECESKSNYNQYKKNEIFIRSILFIILSIFIWFVSHNSGIKRNY
ncbi:MAG: hypothetical protein QXU40_03160 [Candidatus Pacearchaeota archaeon]